MAPHAIRLAFVFMRITAEAFKSLPSLEWGSYRITFTNIDIDIPLYSETGRQRVMTGILERTNGFKSRSSEL
jgi:hypothetical protein